eukprot:COSAG01_NODE_20034_length_974_cov_120.961143_2_plen_248_part_01
MCSPSLSMRQMLGKFTFSQKSTDMLELLKFTGAVFDKSGGEATSSSGAPLQLMFVISDGIVPAKRSEARSLIRQSAERGRMCASVIIDPPAHLRTGEDAQPSIFKRRVRRSAQSPPPKPRLVAQTVPTVALRVLQPAEYRFCWESDGQHAVSGPLPLQLLHGGCDHCCCLWTMSGKGLEQGAQLTLEWGCCRRRAGPARRRRAPRYPGRRAAPVVRDDTAVVERCAQTDEGRCRRVHGCNATEFLVAD